MRNKIVGIVVFMLLITSSTAAVVAWNFNHYRTQNYSEQPLDRDYREYGDAPEGTNHIAYPATGVTGAFPTCMGCGPALWIQHNNFGAWFGPAFDFELEGNAGWCPGGFPPYDQDEGYQDGDAGLIIPQPYTINAANNVVPFAGWIGTALGTTGQVAVWGVNVDIWVHNTMPGHAPYVPAYVNVLMDWNQNGAWGNPGEHVLQNFVVPPLYIGPLSALLPPNFVIGLNPGYVWTRFSITETAVPLNWNGAGEFEDGETEDYLLHINETEEQGWYYKPAYANYAPQGMPDFDQRQDQWKSIVDGGNGVANTNAVGDDIQVVPAGGAVNPGDVIIAPGPNCMLNSNPAGDDIAKWAFCGPVAVANCFWWFDSKFDDPNGHPGDGVDNFSLVQNYGVGDDHSKANVPFLIKDLAVKMNTTTKGTTNITDMKNAIQTWLVNKGLSPIFTVNKYNAPNFSFIEDEIERCQDVILLLGFYNDTGKLPDQMQMNFNPSIMDNLQPFTWWDYQSFKPTVNKLDAINITLLCNGVPCNVMINVYNALGGPSLGSSILNPGPIGVPTWVQFHFNPSITLVPNQIYYFDVSEVTPPQDQAHYEWFYWTAADNYPRGQGWKDNIAFNFDWTFRTEYYPESPRLKGHFVTCAGVNSNLSKIAISDPELNIQNPAATDHNDTANVSHDIYSVGFGSPLPTLPGQWWLQNYSSVYSYAIVEQAVIVCPRVYNYPPTFGAPTPANGSTNNPRNLVWTIPINDPEGNQFSWTIQCSNGQTTSGTGASNGTKSLALSGLAYSTMYKVWVNATDPTPTGSGIYTRKWYTFTTKVSLPPVFGTPSPANGSTNNPLSLSWSIPINDPEGDQFSWTIQCSNGQTTSGTGASNGTKSLALSGLAYSTTYKVWVNATDPTGSGLYTRKWYTFSTKVNLPPTFGTPTPSNGSTNNPLSLSWSIPINDPEGNPFSWTIQCSNGQVNSGTGATNGTKSLTLSGLAYSTTYKVWVNATDPTGSGLYTRKWYTFTTKASQPPVFGSPNPANGSTNNPLSLTWSISINDPEGDTFSWTIQCSNGQVNSGAGATNGTKSLALSGLAYSTTYKIWVNATDPTGSGLYTRKWYTFTTQQQQNVPPNKPNKPSGTASGKINTVYTYTTSTTDPNGDQVYYMWDWGDGTQSNWLGPYNSGVTISTTHKWTVKGSYSIKVKAKDTSGAESPWSDPLPITMPCSYNSPILQFLELLFERFPHAFPLLRHLLGW
jgi:hypothetical protein